MTEYTEKQINIQNGISHLEKAACEISSSLVITNQPVDAEILDEEMQGFFYKIGHNFLLRDFSRFTTELSAYNNEEGDCTTWGRYESYIGMSLGSMVAVKAGVDIEVLRFKYEHIVAPKDKIQTRIGRYGKSFYDSNTDPVIELLPNLFDKGEFQYDYVLGLASALNIGLQILSNPRNRQRMEKAQRKTIEQQNFLLSDAELTTAHL